MHPDIALAIIARQHRDLQALAGAGRKSPAPRAARRARAGGRWRAAAPSWQLTWSAAASRPGGARGRTWLTIISARFGHSG